MFLRVGPYICAEWNYGGFPPYLRDEPGITIRTMNKAYCARVENYYMKLAEVVTPHLASNGGPITLLQVENEYLNIAKRYAEQGQEYLRWIVDLANRAGFSSVPTITCEGGAKGAIETANGFTIPPKRITTIRETHPGTPLLWTELSLLVPRVGRTHRAATRPALHIGIDSRLRKSWRFRLELLHVAWRLELRQEVNVPESSSLRNRPGCRLLVALKREAELESTAVLTVFVRRR